jgi:hypothetical protein
VTVLLKIVMFQSPHPERKDEKRRQVLADTKFQAWQASIGRTWIALCFAQ